MSKKKPLSPLQRWQEKASQIADAVRGVAYKKRNGLYLFGPTSTGRQASFYRRAKELRAEGLVE